MRARRRSSVARSVQAELHLVLFMPPRPARRWFRRSSFRNLRSAASPIAFARVAQDQALALRRVSLHAAGRPYEQICRLARRLEIDLIITATRGRTGLKHLALGSTAERVVRHAPCPVLVVHPPTDRPVVAAAFKRGPGADRFLTVCRAGLAYAQALAMQFGSRLILLHSVDLSYYSTSPEYVLYDLPPLVEAAEKSAREQMLELISATDWEDLEVRHTIENGHPGEEVCRCARVLDADLIVTSTHGRTGLKRILLGSTAEYIVRHASCPVLVVPSHQRLPVTSGKGGHK